MRSRLMLGEEPIVEPRGDLDVGEFPPPIPSVARQRVEIGSIVQMREPRSTAMLIPRGCVGHATWCEEATGDRFTCHINEEIERELLAARLTVPLTMNDVVPMEWQSPIAHLHSIPMLIVDTDIGFHEALPHHSKRVFSSKVGDRFISGSSVIGNC